MKERSRAEDNLLLAAFVITEPEKVISIPDEYLDLRTEAINKALHRLDLRTQKIIVRRFGLDGGRQRQLIEVGEEFRLTRERIRREELAGLRKLGRPRENGVDLSLFLLLEEKSFARRVFGIDFGVELTKQYPYVDLARCVWANLELSDSTWMSLSESIKSVTKNSLIRRYFRVEVNHLEDNTALEIRDKVDQLDKWLSKSPEWSR